MRYEELIRDARDEALTKSGRVRAAFDALYACCLRLVDADGIPADNGTLFARSVVERALTTLTLSADDAALVSKLADWVLNVAPLEPLPMSPEEAVALAERVHKTPGKDAC
ncbi:hypothetical protein SAMN05446935_0360 [Burkholderia sp. YR290]|nr:hypothetical protein SAMN05446935_0360 [Burkholderia sp. YR290]